MGPTRFPYGQAQGFANQFNYTQGPTVSGTAGLISGSTAPNVTLGQIFYLNNTGSLVITNLLLDDTANRISNYEGKVVRLIILDTGSTTFAAGGPLNMAGSDNLAGQNNQVEFMFSRGQWWETDRSKVGNDVTTFTTNVGSSINIQGVKLALLNNTGSTTNSIGAFSNGYIGQEITLALVGSNAVRLISGNMVFPSTNALLINASAVYKFVKILNNEWRVLSISSGALA